MSASRSWGLLLRQLAAHRAFVLRRSAAEAVALGLARIGARVPGAAALAARLDRNSPAGPRVLAERAAARGDAASVERHRHEAERRSRNTAEISIVTALRNTFAWRRSGASRGGAAAPVAQALADGRLEDAVRAAEQATGSPGSRIDGWVAVARAALAAGKPLLAAPLLERASRLDAGRADVWRTRGELALAQQRPEAARDVLERATALDPHDAEAFRALGDACAPDAPARAREAWLRALELRPQDDAVLLRLENAEGERATQRDEPLRVTARATPTRLAVGETREVEIELDPGAAEAGLWVLEPFGAGLLCAPNGRLPLAPGTRRLRLRLTAVRPDAVNGGRPWALHLALCDGRSVARETLEVAVADETPARVFYLITEDHEVYDEREVTELAVVRRTLVEKSRLAEQLANQAGACWTHMVDVGSLGLVAWAAEHSDAWRALHEDCVAHLIDAVAGGNDLGLHCHGFHDPDWSGFVHGFDADADRVTTDAAFLERSIPERGFWSRAFPTLGDPDEPGTRTWSTWKGLGRLEALGRLGDPGFGVTLFRAGSLDYGEDAAERARSTAVLQRLGVLADSDVPKPRLYHRLVQPTPYPVAGDIREPASDAAAIRLLEVRAEFNIESDFLSDQAVLDRYVDLRMQALRDAHGRLAPGVHVICCMTHDKFINWRMGRAWDSLDPDYGDWATIRGHLRHVASRHPELRFARPRDAVLTWWDHYAPELRAWRAEEVVVLSEPDAERETFRYPLRLLGRDIPVDAEHLRRVRVLPPAWLDGRIHETWIERDGARWPARRLPIAPHPLEFEVDDRAARWELVVLAEAGDGIVRLATEADGHSLRVGSVHGYRRATLELPAELAPDGVARRLRGVALHPVDGRYQGHVRLDGEATGG